MVQPAETPDDILKDSNQIEFLQVMEWCSKGGPVTTVNRDRTPSKPDFLKGRVGSKYREQPSGSWRRRGIGEAEL